MANTTSIDGGLLGALALTTNTAVGFNVFTVDNRGYNVTIRIYNVGSSTPDYTTTIPTVTGNTPVFFGYTGTVGIKQVEILTTPGTGDVALDNFSYGITGPEGPPPPTDTPEVPTLGYVGIGFLAVLLGSNRKVRLPGRSRR
ncbi:MAG: hypothetical protein JST93_08290 [Acidobacteria bacterium]|nr:hypothetical protein [Acidobacteriota bacterium]